MTNNNRIWYGMTITRRGGLLVIIQLCVMLFVHEFGHWLVANMIGVTATFGIVTEPILCAVVQTTGPRTAEQMFLIAFGGGGFVAFIGGLISIKSRLSLSIVVLGVSSGLAEMIFYMAAYTNGGLITFVAQTPILLAYLIANAVPMYAFMIPGFYVRQKV